ncbi:MAG: ABC transporter ATP-binding protein [Thermodesulfobacteriota bacterium]
MGTRLGKSYGPLPVVKDASLTVARGELVSLVGKSGCGKTTLLSLLSGMEQPSTGEVILDGVNITRSPEDALAQVRREKVGFIFQSFHLIPTLSAWENVALPLFPLPMTQAARRTRAQALLDRLGLAHRLEHLPAALSGGEKQRVAIARALVNQPKIIFADEPTGNLDSKTGGAIMDILSDLHRREGVAILMVTHDETLAATANRVVHMHDGEVTP